MFTSSEMKLTKQHPSCLDVRHKTFSFFFIKRKICEVSFQGNLTIEVFYITNTKLGINLFLEFGKLFNKKIK